MEEKGHRTLGEIQSGTGRVPNGRWLSGVSALPCSFQGGSNCQEAARKIRHHSSSSKHRQMAVSPTRQPESERKHSKVAIKPLKRNEESWNQDLGSGTRPPRVRRACESCRNRKIKCYGEQPTCRHCRELGIDCYYASGRRDQRRKYGCPLSLHAWHSSSHVAYAYVTLFTFTENG